MKKRKLFLGIMIVIQVMMLMIAVPALAAPADGETDGNPLLLGGFMTLDMLGSFSFCVGLILIFTEALKLTVKYKINPIWYTLILTFLFMGGRYFFVEPATTAAEWYLAVLNSGIVMLTAMGLFDLAGQPLERFILRKKEQAQQQYPTDELAGGGGEGDGDA